MADRYTGRHIHQTRHGAWVQKKRSRSRPSHTVLPTAAALTISGVLIGGAGAVIQFGGSGAPARSDYSAAYDPADYPPPDRNAQLNRASRDEPRTAAGQAEQAEQQGAPGDAVVTTTTGSCTASLSSEVVGLTAATGTLPVNSMVRVTNLANGKTVDVWVSDRDSAAGECLDLSEAAFEKLAGAGQGVVDVRYEVLIEDAT